VTVRETSSHRKQLFSHVWKCKRRDLREWSSFFAIKIAIATLGNSQDASGSYRVGRECLTKKKIRRVKTRTMVSLKISPRRGRWFGNPQVGVALRQGGRFKPRLGTPFARGEQLPPLINQL